MEKLETIAYNGCKIIYRGEPSKENIKLFNKVLMEIYQNESLPV